MFQKFKEFQALVERMFDRKILAMQTDWGGEYQKLNSFFDQIGITHLVSCPHTHQQNGAAERKHRHIVEVGLSLLSHASMPLKFWDEAFTSAAYLINRTPSRVINNSTPLKLLFHRDPDYSFLRIFGCACWPNLRPYNSHKLEFRSKRCAFLGYSHLHKGYKCLDIATGRIYISRDITFDGNIFPFSELHPNAGSRLCSEINLLHPTLSNSGEENVVDQYANTTNSFSGSVTENAGANTAGDMQYPDVSLGATPDPLLQSDVHAVEAALPPASPDLSPVGGQGGQIQICSTSRRLQSSTPAPRDLL